jgi:hypothetical protein
LLRSNTISQARSTSADLAAAYLQSLGLGSGSARPRTTLKINLFPPRIWRRDAYVVFKTVGRTLATLEEMDRAYFYISAQHSGFVVTWFAYVRC